MNIIPVIRDLLLRNQRAVVPGLGSFIVVQRAAQINKTTRVITPPKMFIKFDTDQQTDDGSLLGYLVRKLKQDTQTSEAAINEFVRNTISELQKNGSVLLEGLGRLSKQKAGDTGFEPDNELLSRLSLFELPGININTPQPDKTVLPPVIHKEPVIHKTPVIHQEKVIKRKKSRWWIPAAILLLIMGLLAPVYFTGNLDTLVADTKAFFTGKEPQKEKLVFGKPAEADIDTTNPISRQLDEQVARENALAFDEKENLPDPENEKKPGVTGVAPPVDAQPANKPYHIIAGSFLVEENAKRNKSQLEKEGLSPVILPKTGKYYMVSLGSYDNRSQAVAYLKQMQEKTENELWVMKR